MSRTRKFLRLPEVIGLVGIKRTAIYERIKAETFPAPIKLGARAVVWDSLEIEKWQEEQVQESRSKDSG